MVYDVAHGHRVGETVPGSSGEQLESRRSQEQLRAVPDGSVSGSSGEQELAWVLGFCLWEQLESRVDYNFKVRLVIHKVSGVPLFVSSRVEVHQR